MTRRMAICSGVVMLCVWIAATARADVVISELMYHDSSVTGDGEFLELHNSDALPVDLGGWCVDGVDFCFDAGATIGADAYVVLASVAGVFEATYGFPPDYVYEGRLSNGGELIQLLDGAEVVVDQVQYEDCGEWPPTADGEGPSLERIVYAADGNTPRNWHASTAPNGHTAGAANSVAATDLPPWISSVTHPVEPAPSDPILVTAVVDDASSVTLTYLIDFGADVQVAMFDDGMHGDGAAADGVFGATIPGQSAAALVRYRITAVGVSGSMQYPRDDDTVNYTGTIVHDASVVSDLPVMHWYIDPGDYADALAHIWTDETEPAVLWYNGVLFDNIRIRVRGQSARTWQKKHWKFRMPQGHDVVDPDHFPIPIDQFNLQGNRGDKSNCREILSYESFRDAGGSGNIAFPVRIEQNGSFYGLYTCVEAMDAQYLERNDIDTDGAWYKAFDDARYRSESTLPSYYEKKTRLDEDYADLVALLNGINNLTGQDQTDFLFENFDLPGMINYLAVNCLIHNNDFTHKNYYLYRDSNGTQRWVMHPWDMDLTFGRVATWPTGGVLNDGIYADNDEIPDRPDVSPSHPLFGDSAHQKWDYRWNRIIDVLYAQPRIREMYHRRLRTLMDELLVEGRYEARLAELVAVIAPEAEADRIKWGQYGQTQTLEQAVGLIEGDYLPRRRNHFFVTHRIAGEIPETQTAVPHIVISEIMYHPAGDDEAEFVELYNPSAVEAVDLSGWRLRGVSLTFPGGTVLPANDYLVVVRNDVHFRATYDAGIFVAAEYDGALANEGERLELSDQNGQLIDIVRFEGNAPWPAYANGGGRSLELIDAEQDNNRFGNWAASLTSGGTPGQPNSVAGTTNPSPDLWVNEAMPVNASLIADEGGAFEPWIEIYNGSTGTIDLGGMYLTDDYGIPNKWQIPAATMIQPDSWLVVWADNEPEGGSLHASFRLNVDGGAVGLYSSALDLVDYLNYPAVPEDRSYGKFPDGMWACRQFDTATPGAANQGNGTALILNEYNAVGAEKFLDDNAADVFFGRAQGNGGNWLELVVTQNNVDMRGWKLLWTEDPTDAGTLTFTDHVLWTNLRAGTIVTLTECDSACGGLDSDLTYDPENDDWWININTRFAGAPDETYVTAVTNVAGDGPGNFSVGNDNWQLTIEDADGHIVFGPAGEGIEPASGVSSTEVWRLEQDPGAHVHPHSNYDDGTSSTFGMPNVYAAGTKVQDFGTLRGNRAPEAPILLEPTDGAAASPANPQLRVIVGDADFDELSVTFFGDSSEIGTVSAVESGRTVSVNWPGRQAGVSYEWYVVVSDGDRTTVGPRWTFTSNGACGTASDCDDGNGCTDDACTADVCAYADNSAPCDDGLFCTAIDVCSQGVCAGSGETCPGQLCDEIAHACVECLGDTDCDDDVFCNGPEICQEGACVAGVTPCQDPCEACDEANQACTWCMFDLDMDGFIGPGDFAFVAGCYGSNHDCDPPTYRSGDDPCCQVNFDGSADGFVGPGDFAGFAGCFGSGCGACVEFWHVVP